MSTIADFNRIEDCDKIDALCVDASIEAFLDDTKPSMFRLESSWGNSDVDLTPAIKSAETLTTLYLSPDDAPNCLVYEPERGDNICISGDELSRIISMAHLKDVDQATAPSDGDIYIYNGETKLFEPYDIKTFINNTTTAISDLQDRMTAVENRVSALENTVAEHETRITTIETKLTPPSDAPSTASVVFGNINVYSDSNAVVNSSGVATSLDKTHGLYTHTLATNAYGDELFG